MLRAILKNGKAILSKGKAVVTNSTPCLCGDCGGGGGTTGACCEPDGSCSITSESICSGLGGTYQGNGTNCDTTGACCLLDGGGCIVTTSTCCEAAGGTYQGDDIPCSPDPCQVGACCVDTDCTVTTRGACESGGGIFQGATDCSSDPCTCGGAFQCRCCTTFVHTEDCIDRTTGYGYSDSYTTTTDFLYGTITCTGGGTCTSEGCTSSWSFDSSCNQVWDSGPCDCPCVMIGCTNTDDGGGDCFSQFSHSDCSDGRYEHLDWTYSPYNCFGQP